MCSSLSSCCPRPPSISDVRPSRVTLRQSVLRQVVPAPEASGQVQARCRTATRLYRIRYRVPVRASCTQSARCGGRRGHLGSRPQEAATGRSLLRGRSQRICRCALWYAAQHPTGRLRQREPPRPP